MDGWRELSRTPLLRPPRDPGAPQQVTCTLFDEQSDLVWAGDSAGFIAGYAGTAMAPYTRFAAHEGGITQLVSHVKGILSTDGKSLRLTNRRGLVVFSVSEAEFPELGGIARMALSGTNEVLLSTNSGLVKFDIAKPSVVSTIAYEFDVVLMASNKRQVAIGRRDGSIDIYEVKSGSIIHTFATNSTTLCDMDLKESTLVVCGLTRRHGAYSVDPLVNVFDLRVLRSISPIPFPSGASFVRLHPKLASVAVIASKLGQLQVVDMFNPSRVYLYQADVGQMMLALEISSTGDFLTIVDVYSIHHLWAHNPEHSTMSNRVPLDYPDPVEPSLRRIDIDENIPLSSVGMPYYKETLLSAWPSQAVFKSAGTIPKAIDQSILRSATINRDGFLQAHYDKDKYGRRNQERKYAPINSISTGKFLSNKNGSPSKNSTLNLAGKDEDDIFAFTSAEPHTVPNAFKKLEILYSKFGIDDFDFDSYNRTQYSGLECHVDNSYTNALLQLYRFVPEMFNFVIGNLAIENLESDSLLTELGYLYDMLVKAAGKHYRATNFQHTLSSIDEAAQSGLIDREHNNEVNSNLQPDLTLRNQWFNAFLLNKLATDEEKSKQNLDLSPNFKRIFGLEVQHSLRRHYSGEQDSGISLQFYLDVKSPVLNNHSVKDPTSFPKFTDFLESSMNSREQKQVTNRYGQFDVEESEHTVQYLPPVLSCNLILSLNERRALRDTKNWLKTKFYAKCSKDGFVISSDIFDNEGFSYEYELVGFVAEISGETEKDAHLVTFVQIYDAKINAKIWYLFNDFMVIPITEEEVLNVSYWWKTPVTLVYRKSANSSNFDYNAWHNGLNDEILYRDHFAAGTREQKKIEYELLTRQEAPKPGSLVAIDTEFVTLEEEHYEIKSSGARSLLKPSNQALARVSVLRGDSGDKFGVPFIDDWVVIKEGIHDYLTSYSGVEPGDLDPATSNKSLVTRQTVYRKLWLLLNLGCVFVGHGLTKDFRTINISVPKSQVRDTAVFFYKGQRILSLRFLAYVLLDAKVQEGNHDSIEDAHTALLLFKEYEKLKHAGNFEDVLDYIYQEGQALKFKPPGEE